MNIERDGSNYDNRVKKMITVSCAVVNVSQAELARRLDMRPQGLNRKLKSGNISIEELDSYVKALGGELEIGIRFSDDTVVKG